jgi:hypothetical protein
VPETPSVSCDLRVFVDDTADQIAPAGSERCAVPKLAHGGWAGVLRSSGCSAVFADQAAGGSCALDLGGDIGGLSVPVERRPWAERLMGPVTVVVPGILGQDLPQVLLAVDQQAFGALAAQCAHETPGEGVRPGRLDRGLDDPRAVPCEDVVERRGELAVAVADQDPETAGPVAEPISGLRACWMVQAPVGWAVTPRMCTVWVPISITNRTYRRRRMRRRRAGSRRPGSRWPGRPGTALRSVTPGVVRA